VRPRLSLLLPLLLLGACAGQLRDYVGPRAAIVSPQLIRYGHDLAQIRCVGDRLSVALTPLQLRLFVRAAGAVRQGYFDPARLTPRDLLHVASAGRDRAVPAALAAANAACGVVTTPPPPPAPVVVAAPAPPPRASTWLNLGAAGSGQAIAVDAGTIEQDGTTRTAMFRMTDPGAAPSPDIFALLIDCTARTIDARSRHRLDAAGTVTERRDYPHNPLPVEGGTVMEIAWLAMCT
jgi:hypothetical protein